MDLAPYNDTVNALNHRLLWSGTWPGQILPATDKQHIACYATRSDSSKPASLRNLQWAFQEVAEQRFIHQTIFQTTPVTVPRYGRPQNDPDGWESLPDATIGYQPSDFYYWRKGWDYDRQATPMQHIAPMAWLEKPRLTILNDWNAILTDLQTGIAQLQYLPYTAGIKRRYQRTETFTTWSTFGNGTIDAENTTETASATAFYTLEHRTYPGTTGNSGPSGNFQFQMVGICDTLLLKNPYSYPIEITLLTIRTPLPITNNFIAGVGICDTTYNFPTPRLQNGFWDVWDYGCKFWNSVTNAQLQTQTIQVPAMSTGTFGPTTLDNFNVPTLSQYLWTNAPTDAARRTAGDSGREFKILAYYHPLTESAQTP